MKSQRNKECLYNHTFTKGIKIIAHTVIEKLYQTFDYS